MSRGRRGRIGSRVGLLALALACVAGPAWAQGGAEGGAQVGVEEVQEQLVDMEGLELVAERRARSVERMSPRERARFDALRDLKRSFLPRVQRSAQDAALE